MANVVITSTTNSIKVDLGIYGAVPVVGYDKVTIPKSKVIDMKLKNGNAFVEVVIQDDGKWTVSYNARNNAFVVDTVDGVAPTSNPDLYTKLIALIA